MALLVFYAPAVAHESGLIVGLRHGAVVLTLLVALQLAEMARGCPVLLAEARFVWAWLMARIAGWWHEDNQQQILAPVSFIVILAMIVPDCRQLLRGSRLVTGTDLQDLA